MLATIRATTRSRRTPRLRDALTAALLSLAITSCRQDPTTPAQQAPQPQSAFARRANNAVPPIVADPTRALGDFSRTPRAPRVRVFDASLEDSATPAR